MPEANEIRIGLALVPGAFEASMKRVSRNIATAAKKMGLSITQQGLVAGKAYKGQIFKLTELSRKTKLTQVGISQMGHAARSAGIQLNNQGRVIGRVTRETRKAAAATTQYGKTSRQMRLVTTGVRRQLGLLRNQLLLVFFAFHALQRVIRPAVSAFAQFEKQLVNIKVMMVRDIGPAIRKFEKQIVSLAKSFGLGVKALGKSMFDIYSATGEVAKSMAILNAATRLAIAGGSTLEETTSGLVTVMEAYKGKAISAKEASIGLFMAQVKARATIGQLAAEVGKFLPIAAKLNIPLTEALMLYSKLTVGIGDYTEAATAMRGILNAIMKPTKDLTALAEREFGMSVQRVVMLKGLLPLLAKLGEAEIEQLGRMVRRVRALTGVIVATEDLKKIIEDITFAEENALMMQKAIEEQMDTTTKATDKFKEAWKAAGRELGRYIAGPGRQLMDWLTKTLKGTKNLAIFLTTGFIPVERERIDVEKEEIETLGTLRKEQQSFTRQLEMLQSLEQEIAEDRYQRYSVEKERFLTRAEAMEWWYQKVMDTEQKLAAVNRVLLREAEAAEEEAARAKAAAWRKAWEEEAESHKVSLINIMQDTATAAEKAFSDLFFDALTGELKSLEDSFRSFGRAVIRILTDALAKLLVWKVILPSLGIPIPAMWAHQGGLVTKKGIRSYQFGGEVPALLEPGEGVVSRRGMATLGGENLAKLNRGEGFEGPQIINIWNIQTIDAQSFRDHLAQHPDIYEVASETAIQKNAALRHIIKGFT